jgi:serine/threonine-protein kinase
VGDEDRKPIFEIGEVLGRVYEIRRVLGSGGMGQVLEAHDHSLDRRVAIKASWPDLDLPPLREEARAMAAFRHPTLITVHCMGVHRNTDYIVMERIYGVSLSDMLTQRLANGQKFSVQDAVPILKSVAEGLAVVHQAGIAHRDVKPENIMLSPDGRVVLMDFGLFLPEFRFARADLVAGSPPYMAAEALTGDLEPGSGPLVDIHALGVTAFELLAGDLPRTANSLPELYEVHLAPPPSLRDFRKDVPDGLVKLVDEMLSFEPGDRPQSVESIAWRLAAVLDEKPPAEAHGIEKVLIVDDDEDIAKLEKFYVTRTLGSDVQVRVAKDGEEAIAAVAEFEPDVMLLDLHMPKLNGIEVAMYMRGSHVAESCTIVLVSAGAQEHDRQLLNQLGIRHFLVKGGELGKQLGELLETLSG